MLLKGLNSIRHSKSIASSLLPLPPPNTILWVSFFPAPDSTSGRWRSFLVTWEYLNNDFHVLQSPDQSRSKVYSLIFRCFSSHLSSGRGLKVGELAVRKKRRMSSHSPSLCPSSPPTPGSPGAWGRGLCQRRQRILSTFK